MGNHRGQDVQALFGIDLPIIQAPMAGATTPAMVAAVSEAGGLGSLPTAMYSHEQLKTALEAVRAATNRPYGLNFFCHIDPGVDEAAQARWRARLAPYYAEAGLDPEAQRTAGPGRAPFDDALCEIVEAWSPAVVSFHFGLPEQRLLDRVRAAGAKVISSATTVAEARWLDARGVDAVIAMGYEAGGHRGSFLTDDMTAQVGTMALVPQVVDAVSVPVIAAGGIADSRGVAAAFALGASAVQVGTAYLRTPEATVGAAHAQALANAAEGGETTLTNVFTGRPARGFYTRLMREVGPLAAEAPPFPTAGFALAPLRSAAEAQGRGDFTSQWAGQAAALAKPMSSREVTLALARGLDIVS